MTSSGAIDDSQADDLSGEHARRDDSRRGFIRGSSLLLAGALPAAGSTRATAAHAGGSGLAGELKVGLIGCGYQGLVSASELLSQESWAGQIRLTALADAFPDRLQQTLRTLRSRFGEQVRVDAGSRFVGWHAYQELVSSDVDLVLLATPPVFRPQHAQAAVAAGKHVHAELPVAVDVSGLLQFRAAAIDAAQQRLAFGVGCAADEPTRGFESTLAQLRQGAIGRLTHVTAACAGQHRKPWTSPKPLPAPVIQLRNWWEHAWASGGADVERRVGGLHIANMLFGGHPREARPREGDTAGLPPGAVTALAHQVVYTYPCGGRLLCGNLAPAATRGKGCWLTVYGRGGRCDLNAGEIYNSRHELVWTATRETAVEATQLPSWESLLASIASGSEHSSPLTAADATLTALLGGWALLSGQPLGWDACLADPGLFDRWARPPGDLDVDRLLGLKPYCVAGRS